jgi:2-oxoglutarate dehydrogenase E2 component (dihydrolipoamide succinyltransferase)
LGDSITTAVLLSWNKKPGDAVAADDVIGVVETDKVTMDIRSKLAGVMGEQLCKAGDEISVGADIYRVNTDAKSAASAPKASAPVAAAPAPAANAGPVEKRTVNVPIMGESITTGILSSWFSKVGDQLQADHVVAAIETDKVTVEVRTPHAGVLAELLAKAGDEVNVGNPLFVINAGATSAAGATPAPKAAAPAVAKQAAAPAAKPAAPVAAAAAKPAAPKAVAPAAPAAAQGSRTETRVKMTRMRVRIAQRLKESQATAAMLTTFQEVDMHNLIEMRNAYKDSFEKAHGVKLGFMSAFVNASTRALQEIPAVNAVIDDATQEIVYRNYVDVSVAVASPTGLVVPVLRNTEKMGFADVEKAISAYGNKAKNGTLALEEMTGGTFTISNGGVFGSLMGTPIINPPQSAILGMHATKMRPMVMPDGSIKARPMMYLALTYDHRLIDGREAVTFLKSVANKIEDPHRLLLGL